MREKERMEKDVSNYQLLSVDELMSNGTVFENSDQFEQSIFSSVYKRAEELLEQIIKDNCVWRKNKKQEFKSSNVLSFIGRRGTGKTSAMCSFAQTLKESRENSKFESVNFHVLERIDASTLEASEDLFLLILASMFTRLLNREEQKSGMIQGYENRVLFEKFEHIFEDFKTLDEHADNSGYSIFEQLKNMASSQKIRENFEKLVDLYLDEMSEYNGKQNDSYLVVLIDDLDMAKQKREQKSWNWGSYKIMSSISKYLTVPRVIVLTAYNAENLYSQCINYYKIQYEGSLAKYESLASQYMEKVFPIYTRLYMPSWKKMDLDTTGKVRIKIDEYQNSKMHEVQKKKNGHLTIREFIMILLAEKTGIYFNLYGEKPHYLEPDTLRILFNVTVLLNGLKSYRSEDEEKEFDTLLFNLDVLKKDCLFRFASDQLSDVTSVAMSEVTTASSERQRETHPKCQRSAGGFEYELFHEWQGMPIASRSEKIVEWISPQIKELNGSGRGRIFGQIARVPYSYAELIHCIYAMQQKETDLSPEFANCILYSYTLYMTELYKKYLYYKRKVKKDEYISLNRRKTMGRGWNARSENINITMAKQYYNELKKIMGAGIFGKWTEYYFPQVRFSFGKDIKERKYRIGYVEGLRWEFSVELDAEVKSEETVDPIFVNYIKCFLFVSMLHTNAMNWNQDDFKCTWITAGDKTQLQLTFLQSHANDDFDLTMPFFYTFCYAEYLAKFEYEIQTALDTLIFKSDNIASKQKEDGNKATKQMKDQIKVKEKIKLAFNQIWSEYYDWDQNYGNMALPISNLDIMYNMMISVYEECKGQASVKVVMNSNEQNLLELYQEMLMQFAHYLYRNDQLLGLDEEDSYRESFVNSPLWNMVGEWSRVDGMMETDPVEVGRLRIKKKITQYLMNIINYLATDGEIEQSPD